MYVYTNFRVSTFLLAILVDRIDQQLCGNKYKIYQSDGQFALKTALTIGNKPTTVWQNNVQAFFFSQQQMHRFITRSKERIAFISESRWRCIQISLVNLLLSSDVFVDSVTHSTTHLFLSNKILGLMICGWYIAKQYSMSQVILNLLWSQINVYGKFKQYFKWKPVFQQIFKH